MRLLFILLVAGCANEATIQQSWDDWVADHNACEAATDCAVVYPGCPLGCAEAVSAAFESDARAQADRLIRRYERGGRSCAYDCIEPGALVCDDGSCGFDGE